MAALCVLPALAFSACGQAHEGTRAAHQKPLAHRAPDPRLPAGVVARVGPSSITTRTLEHWIGVQASLDREPGIRRPVPRGALPVPPRYRDCIAYLATIAGAERAGPAPGAAQLKRRCEAQLRALREQALEALIVYSWIEQEAAMLGIRVTGAEVSRVLRREFPTNAVFLRFLRSARLQARDERLVVKQQLLREKWHESLPVYTRLHRSKTRESAQMVGELDAAVGRLNARMTARETRRTYCRAGYVVSVCREYRA